MLLLVYKEVNAPNMDIRCNTLSNISTNPAYGLTGGKTSKRLYTSITEHNDTCIESSIGVSINPAYGINTGRRHEVDSKV